MMSAPLFKNNLKTVSWIFCLLVLVAGFLAHRSLCAADNIGDISDASLYFNAATEKYIQGDLDSAIDNVGKAIALDPANRKYLDFASKILYEGALEAHNSRNYKRAYEMLEKAVGYSPSDEKIQNLYKITKEIISKKSSPEGSKAAGGGGGEASQRQVKSAAGSPSPHETPRSASGKSERDRDPAYAALSARLDYFVRETEELKRWNLYLIIIGSAGCFWFLASSAAIFFMIKKIRRQGGHIKEKDTIIKELQDTKSALVVDLEKLRERLKYEEENSQRLARELKEEKSIKNEHFKQQLRMGLDIRQKQLEEMMKSLTFLKSPSARDMTGAPPPAVASEIYSGRARILETIGDATYITSEENSASALEAVRERIAAQALELKRLSPSAAMNFLKEMASNPNPMIRANILKALSRMPEGWSVDMLIHLAQSDPVLNVRREAIREIKYIRDAVKRGEAALDSPTREKVENFLKGLIEEGEWIF
jgi:tetratricopeptide (TPR) repeat protein